MRTFPLLMSGSADTLPLMISVASREIFDLEGTHFEIQMKTRHCCRVKSLVFAFHNEVQLVHTVLLMTWVPKVPCTAIAIPV